MTRAPLVPMSDSEIAELAATKEMELIDRTATIKALRRIEDLFVSGDTRYPSMIETAWKLYNNDEVDDKGRFLVSAKEKTAIFSGFARLIGVREVALQARGLKADPRKVTNNNFVQINALTLDEIKGLPEPIQKKLMTAQLQAITGSAPTNDAKSAEAVDAA